MPETGTNERVWVEVAASDEIADGQARTYKLEGDRRIAVARADGKLYAVQDLCTHDDGPLGEGRLDGHAIKCPRHGAEFDIRTGEVLQMPAILPIETFDVMEKEGKVLVQVPKLDSSADTADDDW